MMEDHQAAGRIESAAVSRRSVRRRWIVIAACLAAALALPFLLWLVRGGNVDEQFKAIDAAHAVPNSKNAALDYTRLVEEAARVSLDPLRLPQPTRAPTLGGPWCNVDFPQVATWIEERQVIVEALLQAGGKPACWFPLAEAPAQTGKRFGLAYYGSLLLVRAANRDMGEGRMEDGLEKLLCVFEMAGHFRSQLNPSDHDTGKIVAAEGLKRLAKLVVNEDIPPDWLARLEVALPPTEDTWDEESQQLDKIEKLYVRKLKRGVGTRLLYTLSRTKRSQMNRHIYLSHLAEARAGRILLALRYHRDRTGAWPADLAEVADRVAGQTLVEPLTGRSFIYRPDGDTFVLYSTGPDLIDEGGLSGDDYHFWPPSEHWPGRVKK